MLLLLAYNQAISAQDEVNLITTENLDSLYAMKRYEQSALGFEIALRQSQTGSNKKDLLEGAMLSNMRLGRYTDTLRLYEFYKNPDVNHASIEYLGMYASLKTGQIQRSSFFLDRLKTSELSDYATLLYGTIYLENGSVAQSISHYKKLHEQTENPRIESIARSIHSDLLQWNDFEKKSPWLAAGFSAFLPGAGHVYSRQYADGAMALFWTTTFLGSSAVLYNLENQADTGHSASIVMGVFGLLFYFSSIAGAYAAANRYNIYQERRFQQKIREQFFHLDFIESTSGIEFKARF